MENKISNVVGQGTYGCVHSPSLKCKDAPGIIYDNKVSKVLKTKDANTELKEYEKLVKADAKKEYYLGIPDSCNIDNRSIWNLKAIQKCKIGSDIVKNISQYKLLIMGDGGINLEQYTKKMETWPVSQVSTEHCERFLLESLRLFKGLKIFEDNKLIHHDLKPQNIVYDERTNRLNYIDFGLMISKDKIIKKSASSSYDFGLFHWSFPWELEFIQKKEFDNLIANRENADKIINEINDKIKQKKNTYYENIKTYM